MVSAIVNELRSVAQKCAAIAHDSVDEELTEYLLEVTAILGSIASVLEEKCD